STSDSCQSATSLASRWRAQAKDSRFEVCTGQIVTVLSAPLPLGGSMPRRVQPRPIASLQPHPQAGLVPRMAPDAYAAFKADIAARGVQVPIEITSAGVILDGHERRRAAQELAIAELDVLVVEPADEFEHIVLCAIQRRQLSASQ